ncbi:MAG TPA: sortase [Candidatus Dormibacteraeota bacterium]|jgi:LPXTG-site transpeptidase (sortase) family protein|nr:sortase [Candidatus Dormibacteraeota bacterium]
MSSTRTRPATRRRSRRRLGPVRLIGVLIGLALVAGGLVLIVPPLWQLYQRNRVDDNALNQWNRGGSNALVGGGAAGYAGQCGSGTPTENYARVSFPSLAQYGYAGVAGDGTWDMLRQRSMVHYEGTAAPGAKGNDIIAFHREPEYEHIDQLKVGDVVDVQDRNCKTWAYRITGRWQLYPGQVTQLNSTTGNDLTLITCTPFWVDSQRLVWRGTLVTGPGAQ